MLKHIKIYLPTYIPAIVGTLAVTFQTANSYVTNHPKVDFGILLGMCAHAAINHWITSPKNSAVVDAAKEQSNGDTSTTK